MAINELNNILAEFNASDGYATPNRFEVIIYGPSNLGGGNKENKYADRVRENGPYRLRKISLRCESVTLPGRNVSTSTDSNIYGPTREVVEGITYAEDVTLTFQSSSGLDERKYFEQWQENMFNPDTWNISYYEDYVSEIEIYLLDKQNQRRYGLKLWEAFPKTIGPTSLNSSTNTEIIKIDIGFSFRYWTALDITQEQPLNSTRAEMTAAIRKIPRNIPKVFSISS